jgi:hypothetical protein
MYAAVCRHAATPVIKQIHYTANQANNPESFWGSRISRGYVVCPFSIIFHAILKSVVKFVRSSIPEPAPARPAPEFNAKSPSRQVAMNKKFEPIYFFAPLKVFMLSRTLSQSSLIRLCVPSVLLRSLCSSLICSRISRFKKFLGGDLG